MRRRAVIVSLAFLASACTGARGVSPNAVVDQATSSASPSTTLLGPVATPRFVLTAEPVAVPSTTTTLPPPRLPTESLDSTTTTSSTTPPVDLAPSPLPAPGTVALTFDDGPFDGWTDTILEVLDEYDVKATFFVSTYRLPAVAHLIPVMVEAGHSVQSHGDRHDDLTLKTADQIRSDLALSLEKIVAAGAARPTCMRPPYGHTNATVDSVAAELGLEVVGWTLNTLDYSLQDSAKVIETTLANVGDGDNILAHDQWAPVWKDALPAVIEGIVDRGLGFSTICNVGSPDG